MKKWIILSTALFLAAGLLAQWQQRADYQMSVELDVSTHKMTGQQEIRYTNHSPDTLYRVFYHLYYNAFQPYSMMDVRSRTIVDPDRRIVDRILYLDKDEIGYHRINSLQIDSLDIPFHVEGTILEGELPVPIPPGITVKLQMEFDSQVPVQIRRTGRNNAEGIDYSMSQWYPKLCAYDEDGWHSNPYVAREFYGVWGDFDVEIRIRSDYIVAATGMLKDKEEHERLKGGSSTTGREYKTWRYEAKNVHDFVWAADPDYTVRTHLCENGTLFQFYYQENKHTEYWTYLPEIMEETMDYLNERYGRFPYPVFSFIQGGDGGMEYPMATLITGERGFRSLVGVCVHELIHSWYPMLIGTNESLYPWIDEGFAIYLGRDVMNHLKSNGLIPGSKPVKKPYKELNRGYLNFASSGAEEPMSIHADHYQTNTAYSIAAYTKGAVFLVQLRYILGDEVFQRTMLRFFDNWKYRHPTGLDFIREAEKASGMNLDWFHDYFINTTHTIDYTIVELDSERREKTRVRLKRSGVFPMPVDLAVTMEDGSVEYITIPLRVMRGAKEREDGIEYRVLPDWPWTHPYYEFVLDVPFKEIRSLEIDPSQRLADSDRDDNYVIIKN